MKKRNVLLLSLALLASFFTVRAQDDGEPLAKGAETIAFEKTEANVRCLVFGKYVIKTVSGEDVGEDIEVYRRASTGVAKAACDTATAPYYTIKNMDANYFAGLSGDFLLVDSGTGADGRGLEIFNLKSKKSIYTTEYYDQIEIQQGKFVIYDKFSETKGDLKTCRQAAEWKRNGLSLGWVRQAKLDLQTLKETPIGAIRCRAFQ